MRKWGDRRDAVRVRDIDGMHFYMAYLQNTSGLMKNHQDACDVYSLVGL